ncbi:hypothetical protein [Caballeronia sp. GAWG1-1]|uniref:hypothetical protein n=1 Tax=Caballeronia sp. GAWG1-1 TaxID=2921742 RepID=UPI00202920AB|nr:hypothetical protein [Caballeronia sp. GAWG1-1]
MQMAKVRKTKTSMGLAKRAHHKKALFLPLDTAAANRISLRSWTALERARAGDAGSEVALALAHAAMAVHRLVMLGYGVVDEHAMSNSKAGLARVIELGCETGTWRFDENLIASLAPVLDEHHRQLRQVRMVALVEANEWLEAKPGKGALMQHLLQASAGVKGQDAVRKAGSRGKSEEISCGRVTTTKVQHNTDEKEPMGGSSIYASPSAR